MTAGTRVVTDRSGARAPGGFVPVACLLAVLAISMPLVPAGCTASTPEEPPGQEETMREETMNEENAGGSREVESVTIASRVADCAGTRLHLLEAGNPADPGVLLLHGARFSAQTWKELGTIETMARAGHHVVALDLPGFGASPPAPVDDDALAGWLEPLGLGRPVVVAPSMSGRFALPLAARHPQRIRGLVAVAPAAIARFEKELPGAGVPVLVVWGSDDQVFPVSEASRLAGMLPEATVVILEGAPHPCYLEQPERFHRELLAFLQQVEKR